MLAALFVLGAVLLIMWLSGAFKNNDAKTVAIPDVLHQSIQSAKDALRDKGFTTFAPNKTIVCGVPSTGSGPTCTQDDINKVIAIEPGVGTPVSTTAQITLTIGVGPGKASVPDLSNKTRDDAETALTQAKLTLNPSVAEQDVTDPNQVGKVISQNPQAGQEVAEGSQVSITIGKSQALKQVPDYTGKSFAEAKSGLTALGFKINKVEQQSDTVDKDTVITQNPNGGSVAAGSVITVTVSTGSDQIQMPDLTGMTPDEAKSKLQSMGWTGSFNQTTDHSGKGDQGTIVKQNPQPGQKISKGQTVSISVSEGSGFPFPTTSTTGGH